MRTFAFKIIHPNAKADFVMHITAENESSARSIAFRRIMDTYGPNNLYCVGDIIPAR